MNVHAKRTTTGYNLEEFYFERLNHELIQQLKTSEQVNQKTTANPPENAQSTAQIIPFPSSTRKTEKKAA